MSNYIPIITDNLALAFEEKGNHLPKWLPAEPDGNGLLFTAFGRPCRITPTVITLNGQPETGPLGVILSLYAKTANGEDPATTPWQAFVELPDSRPYVGAFTSHTESPLVPYVDRIMIRQAEICDALNGAPLTGQMGGDLALTVTPLPKIQLAYVFYLADEDFPASVKCLFSGNAHRFMPVDGLADVGEYTSKSLVPLLD